MGYKKNICLIIIVILSMLSACGNKMTTNKYDNEAIRGIEIEKTEVYLDKLVITFADKSVSDVDKVEIDYYDEENSIVEERPNFSFRNDTLEIETNHADTVFEMRIWEKEIDLYFHVRNIYSEAYAMLVYYWADDAGYLVDGDEDAYYTQVEKEEQKEMEELEAEAKAFTYSKLMGEWVNESKDVRILFEINEQSERQLVVSELIAGEWKECDSMVIRDLSERETDEMDEIYLYDSTSYGREEVFYLYEDSVMGCSYSDEKFVRFE